MKTRFRAIIQRSDEDNTLEAIYIPSLKYKLDFYKRPNELKLFETLGQQYYLEEKVYSIIEERKKNQDKIEDSTTMALMTQGLSELNGPTHSYDIYFVKKEKDIKPNDIDGIAIVISGEGAERKGFIISNNRFHSLKKIKWHHECHLTDMQLIALEDTPFNPNEPARASLKNHFILNELKKMVTSAAGWIYLGSNSYPLDVYIFDHARRPCNFFATVLPPFIRINNVAQLCLMTVLDFGLLDSEENPFFPPQKTSVFNSTTGNSTDIFIPNPMSRPFNISQIAFNVAISLLFTFAGPRQRSTRGLGLQIDDAFINLYKKMCESRKSQSEKSCRKKCSWLDIKIGIIKAFFFILVLNQVALMIFMSYLRINTISEKIADDENSLFSPEFIKDVSITQWVLSQLQDPMMIAGEAMAIFFIIENYFRPTNMIESINKLVEEESKLDSKPKKSIQIEMADYLKEPLLEEKYPSADSLTQSSATLFSSKKFTPTKKEKSICLVM